MQRRTPASILVPRNTHPEEARHETSTRLAAASRERGWSRSLRKRPTVADLACSPAQAKLRYGQFDLCWIAEVQVNRHGKFTQNAFWIIVRNFLMLRWGDTCADIAGPLRDATSRILLDHVTTLGMQIPPPSIFYLFQMECSSRTLRNLIIASPPFT